MQEGLAGIPGSILTISGPLSPERNDNVHGCSLRSISREAQLNSPSVKEMVGGRSTRVTRIGSLVGERPGVKKSDDLTQGCAQFMFPKMPPGTLFFLQYLAECLLC